MPHILGTTTFHVCPCGYQIEASSKKLIDMKKKYHREFCNKWQQAEQVGFAVVDLPGGFNQHHINLQKNRKNELK
jgi:hypothetical protein